MTGDISEEYLGFESIPTRRKDSLENRLYEVKINLMQNK
jgi:hypothetical protein|tara:strand:- start:520 stop:636 length:117 start_codon:yes stop_codon:yes gene_type:complete